MCMFFILMHKKTCFKMFTFIRGIRKIESRRASILACFITPLLAALILSVVNRRQWRWRDRFSLLTILMWGGAAALITDHVLTGELVPWPPFLTAWNPAHGLTMLLEEILFVGGTITSSIFAVWGLALVAPRLLSSQKLVRIRSALLRL